jgi:hypothetical protein
MTTHLIWEDPRTVHRTEVHPQIVQRAAGVEHPGVSTGLKCTCTHGCGVHGLQGKAEQDGEGYHQWICRSSLRRSTAVNIGNRVPRQRVLSSTTPTDLRSEREPSLPQPKFHPHLNPARGVRTRAGWAPHVNGRRLLRRIQEHLRTAAPRRPGVAAGFLLGDGEVDEHERAMCAVVEEVGCAVRDDDASRMQGTWSPDRSQKSGPTRVGVEDT